MESKRQMRTLFVSVLALIALIVVLSTILAEDENRSLAGAEFLVS